MRKKLSTLFLLTILSLSSCDTLKKASSEPLSLLSSKTWNLESLMGKAISSNDFTSAIPSLLFSKDSKLSGFTGCNNFNGSFNLSGMGLGIDPGAMTKKACAGDGEKKFLNALSQVKSFDITGDKLKLFGDGGKDLLSFVPKL
jgi:heat shock protein HslJ